MSHLDTDPETEADTDTEFPEIDTETETESPEIDDVSDIRHDHRVLGYTITEDGFVVMPRTRIPKKDFDFTHVSKVFVNDPATFAVGRSVRYAPWFGKTSDEDLMHMRADAQFILLTESGDTFASLSDLECHIKHKFFLFKGSADVSSCYFLRLLKKEWRIPIYALLDYDPMSLKLLNFYETWIPEGMSEDLAQVELGIKWLGIRNLYLFHDYEKFSTPLPPCLGSHPTFVVKMDDNDAIAANSLLDTKFVNKSKQRVAEVKKMIDMKVIMEVMALGTHYFAYYLPLTLEQLPDEKESGENWI